MLSLIFSFITSFVSPALIVIEDVMMDDAGECYVTETVSLAAETWDINEGVEIEDADFSEIDGYRMLASSIVIEDDVIFSIAGDIIIEDDVMYATSVTVSLTSDDCGFCDGLCVDGKCIMDPCTNPWGK